MADDLPLHWNLHVIDEEAVRHEAELAKLPGQRRHHETRVATEQRRVETAARRASELLARRRELERDIAAFETQEAKYRKQLDAVTNQHQFEAVQHEIAGVVAKRSDLETEALTVMEAEESLAAERPALAEALAKAQAEAAAALEKFAAREVKLRAELAVLDARRAEVAAPLSTSERSRYDKMRTSRAGHAVAAVHKDACGACYHSLSPHGVQEVRKRDHLLVCEGCGRLLLLPPEGSPEA